MRRFLMFVVLVSFTSPVLATNEPAEYDLVIYGQTSAGVIAAVQAKRMGKSVILVAPDRWFELLVLRTSGYIVLCLEAFWLTRIGRLHLRAELAARVGR
jgi:hypothetical protein